MPNSLPWVRFFAAKWLSSPTRLMMDTSQRAIYLDLLLFVHEHGGRIPNDPAKLAILAAVPLSEFEAAWPAVREHFTLCGDDPTMLTNAVMLQAIEESEERARIARAGGIAKARKAADSTSLQHVHQNRTDTDTDQIRAEENRTESARSLFSSSFLTWWGIYPKRTRQVAAGQAYLEAITSPELHAELMAGTERWISSAQWRDSDGGRFIPDPARFIRDERWREHPPQAELDPFEQAAREL